MEAEDPAAEAQAGSALILEEVNRPTVQLASSAVSPRALFVETTTSLPYPTVSLRWRSTVSIRKIVFNSVKNNRVSAGTASRNNRWRNTLHVATRLRKIGQSIARQSMAVAWVPQDVRRPLSFRSK